MNAQDPVARLFDQVVQDLNPALDVLVERGERRGRKLRTRRRVRLAVGNSLAVAAVVGVGVAVSAQLSKPGAARPAGLSATASASASGSPSPTPATSIPAGPDPNPTSSPSGKASAPASTATATTSRLLDTLRALVPGGIFSNARSAWGPGTLQVDYDDGHGAVDLILSIGPRSSGDAPLTCPTAPWKDEGARPAGALPISCATRTLADGSIEFDAVMYADSYGFYGYDIYYAHPDGMEVTIQVGNGINHGIPQVDRAVPPGSMAQWSAIVRNPVWLRTH